MRILITGVGGQLGSALCEVFGYEAVIPKDLPDFDLTNPNVEEEIIESAPDLIIHAGAYTDVDGAEREPGLALAVNAEGTEQIARAAARLGARLMYISTDYVFDGKQRVPYREDDSPRPINRYGFSKWKGEQAVLASGAKALIIRTAWLYGSVGKNFVKSIMRAAQSEPILKVVNDQSGCPTYAEDLAASIASLTRKDVEGVIHTTNRGQCTWYEFAQAVVREMGFSCSVVPIMTEQAGRLAKRPPYSVLSPDRLVSLGLELPEWNQALARFAKVVPLSLSYPHK
ncbi:MAG: dTDP-4-dehydrorhamnose reductase [Nitrospira sp.]|jgi:dTDP-4-dehydrorhamnose reductase|nr:dTDP-4-dehydrorhamnose reductase [Nitrospira sp.]MDI3464420.1 dTDP-4-dehydrorhamnose reductase [Nitrospira sp.]